MASVIEVDPDLRKRNIEELVEIAFALRDALGKKSNGNRLPTHRDGLLRTVMLLRGSVFEQIDRKALSADKIKLSTALPDTRSSGILRA